MTIRRFAALIPPSRYILRTNGPLTKLEGGVRWAAAQPCALRLTRFLPTKTTTPSRILSKGYVLTEKQWSLLDPGRAGRGPWISMSCSCLGPLLKF